MIHLVTDTTAYAPYSVVERWPIHAVPLKLNVGSRTVDEDKVDLGEFFESLKDVKSTPSTSQPAPGDFMRLYEELTAEGDEVLSVHISEGLSGTVRVAQMTAQEVAPDRITVVDSRATTCVLSMMLLAAARALDAGAGRAEAAALVEEMSETFASAFLVESLDYLAKGGRINGAAKFLGTMLQLRPILHLTEGKIDGLALARTRKRGMQQLITEVKKRVNGQPVIASVTHIRSPEAAEKLAQEVQAAFNCTDFFINETGPVIGAHVGPGFVGMGVCPLPN
ncbi:MAG: DegV family protein [Anaerolineales bacterium]